MEIVNDDKNKVAFSGSKFERARQIFDEMTGESYYGFNMRCVLSNQSPEFLDALAKFVEACKEARR